MSIDWRTNVNYRNLTPVELLNLWHSNRNTNIAIMAADELLNRIYRGDLALVPSDLLRERLK
jgi:hypothetical protein